ncbi:hypothetical protein HX810_20075 [Pseudomonas salomonii]|uniref:Uncharacterized protein n=1 Tax=Pseudomonas salomonii TaxID=191391 RepID=A0A7Y8GH18_9PSED|nr:hypothetical protein [Pseudomonas salomonii]NWF09971.1 hypothetical protein [Pseudomonas salomonii]
MSEVKRYYVNLDHGTRYFPVDGCDQAMNKAEDFDRVTAERDTALECGAALVDQLAELQQRLTAADERADHSARVSAIAVEDVLLLQKRIDVLEGLLRDVREHPSVLEFACVPNGWIAK